MNAQTISPDGKQLLLTATAEGQQNLYTYSLDELSREPAVARQLTSTAGAKADAQFTADSKEVFFLEQGRITMIPLETRTPRTIAVSAEIDADFSQEKLEIFRQAWTYMRDGFYDDKFHGVDWEGVRRTYQSRISGAQSPDEMRRLLNLMVGELNASHMGVAAPGGPQAPGVGKLGLRFDRGEFETNGRLRITEVVPLGPAAITRQVSVGDYLIAVDGTAISPSTNLDELLLHAVNRRLPLRLAKTAAGQDAREVLVQPVSTATEKNLLYREWVEVNRRYVEKVSGGRLGYAHMNDMSEGALRRLYMDLDADNRAKEGVVIDVRNNNGGFVNVYAIDVLARRGYMNMTPRGLADCPGPDDAGTAGARAADDPRHQPALVVRRGGLHRRISDVEAWQGGRRTDVGLDHLHRQRDAARRHDDAHAGHAYHHAGREDDGAQSEAGGCDGDAADWREPAGKGLTARHRRPRVAAATEFTPQPRRSSNNVAASSAGFHREVKEIWEGILLPELPGLPVGVSRGRVIRTGAPRSDRATRPCAPGRSRRTCRSPRPRQTRAQPTAP